MKNKANNILKHLLDDGFDLDKTIKEVDGLRLAYRQQNDTDNANTAWAIMTIVGIHRDYRKVFSLLQSKQYYDAWCLLERIEIDISFLLRNFPRTKGAVEYVEIIVRRLQSLFPYRLFISTVIVITERTCKICGKRRTLRNHCGHYVGHVYAGELCCDEEKKGELHGADLVTNPEHKYAVVFPSDENGKKDNYDYQLLDCLMGVWKDPYSPWHYVTIHTHKKPEEFPQLSEDSLCPCGSGKRYKNCCKDNQEGIKHVIYEIRPGLNPE